MGAEFLKTPMMQLVEKLQFARKQLKEKYTITPEEKGYDDCLTNIINDINLQMLSIEKDLIIDCFSTNEGEVFTGEELYKHRFCTQITLGDDTKKVHDSVLQFLYDKKIKRDQQKTFSRSDFPKADFESVWMHFHGDERCFMHLGGDFLKVTKN